VEHKGVGITLVQSIRRGCAVWTIQTDPPRSGEAKGKNAAKKNAQRSIDIWLRGGEMSANSYCVSPKQR